MNKLINKVISLKYGVYFCSFLVPFFIMGLHYASMEVWPFGDSSVLVLDLNGQYVYFFEAFRDIIREGGSISYTWLRAMGGEFMGIFAYYLASPFSLLTALFPDGWITEALLTIFLLKAGACGLTMSFYLTKTRKADNIKTVIISTMYALSSYAIVQAHNTMWIDLLIYLPLLTYGIEQLIKKRRFVMFTVVLALSMMANYYIGYMICIYTAIYFFYYYIAYSKDHENNFYYEDFHFVKSLVRIGSSALIAVAMAAWVLYPAYYSLTFGKTTFSDPDFYPSLKFAPMDLISKLFFGSYDTVEPSGLPFVYCGTLMLILLPLYFFSKKISTRKKMMGGALLAVFFLSFVISTLDLLWHGFQAPNWLNYRYSFMLIFITLVFSYEVLANIESEDYKRIIISACAVILLLFTVHKLGYYNIGMSAVLGTVLCTAALLLVLHAVKHGYLGRGATLILAVVVCVELFCSSVLTTMDLDEDVVISSRVSYNSFIDRIQPIVDDVSKKDDGFFRMEKTLHRKTNDNLTLGIKGLSNSTSTLNERQITLLNKLGLSSKSHWSKYLGGTPVSDSLLGVKYIITDPALKTSVGNDSSYYYDGEGLYTLYTKDEGTGLEAYYNPYALPIAYGVDNDIASMKLDKYYNPFIFMNDMVTAMLGEDETIELFKEIELDQPMHKRNIVTSFVEGGHTKYAPLDESKSASLEFHIETVTDDPVYMYIPSDFPREMKLTVKGAAMGTYMANETHRIKKLGDFEEGMGITVNLTIGDELKVYIKDRDLPKQYFYYLDKELFEEVMPRLQDSVCKITEHSATELKGSVNIKDGDTTLFTTIPYDEGWHVKIDGKDVETEKTVDSLLCVKIAPGEHDIEFFYRSDAIFYGRIFSIAGTAVFLSVAILDAVMRKKREKRYRNLVDISR